MNRVKEKRRPIMSISSLVSSNFINVHIKQVLTFLPGHFILKIMCLNVVILENFSRLNSVAVIFGLSSIPGHIIR